MRHFRQKAAIATVARSGIGAAIAIDWAARGAHVIANDSDMASAAGTVTRSSSTPGNVRACLAIPENDADQGATHPLRRF